MNNEVSVSSYFTGIEEVFNPEVNYIGDYAFSYKVLSYASKYKDGKNLVEEYFEKKLFKPIRLNFSQLGFAANPRMFLVSDSVEYGRTLRPLLMTFVQDLCFNLTSEHIDLSLDVEEMKIQVRNYLKKFRSNINAILSNTINSDEIRECNEKMYSIYMSNESMRKIKYGKDYTELGYEVFLNKTVVCISNFLVNFKHLVPLFNTSINLKELEECLDLDKFYLAMAHTLIECSKLTESISGKLPYCFSYIAKYVSVVEFIRQETNYDLKIDTVTIDGNKKIKYNVDDAIREFNKLKFAHPEYTVHLIEKDDRDYRDLDVATKYTRELEKLVESKRLAASWNFIRKGNKEEKLTQEIIDNVSKINKKSHKEISLDEKIQNINNRMNFLDHTDYLYKITGKDNFEGYVGYIYANGTVIFEKFYKAIDIMEPADSNATYVMNFDNFVEMSKKNKTEIIKFIKDGGTGVRRLYHTSNWATKILQIILDNTYDVEDLRKIDALINSGEISKKQI